MYENVVDVLIYLYENYMDGDSPPPTDQNRLREELSSAGFGIGEIDKAIAWLDELANRSVEPHFGTPRTPVSMRIYTEEECRKLELESRGFLLSLEQHGIIASETRELAIDRALALQTETIGLDEIKWIVLLVLMSQPGHEAAMVHMEGLLYDDQPVYLH
ncbi:MAG: DUF494 domain-containing protein [Pseudomonadota bacterium]